jgi:histidinol phosphatase-like enzyme
MSDPRPKTIFLDIDGVVFPHAGTLAVCWHEWPEPLPGVREKLHGWDRKGYTLVLTTGRRECMRKKTEAQLEQAGVIYDQLVMGLSGGERVLINDLTADSEEPTASAICLPRNQGLGRVEV